MAALGGHKMPISYANMMSICKKMTMLTPYLLNEFHDFSVYLISGSRNGIWNFSRDKRVNSTKYKKECHHRCPLIEKNT
jgi:hypothetical protein